MSTQEEFLASTKNRVLGLLNAPVIRTHLGVTENSIDVRRLVEERAVVIVDLEPRGQLHETQVSLLATMGLA